MPNQKIAIVLDGENPEGSPQIFVPGQTVSGLVTLNLHTATDVEEISIVFQGECFTRKITRVGDYYVDKLIVVWRETFPFFTFAKILLKQESSTMLPGVVTWSFSFTLPTHLNLHRNAAAANTTAPPVENIWFNMGPQSLPPSLDHWGGKGIPQFEDCGKVTYQLVAEMNPARLLHSERFVLPVMVIPFSDQPHPPPSSEPNPMAQQHYENRSLGIQKHSLKQKVLHIFTNDLALRTPAINFEATAYMPGSAGLLQCLPLAIGIYLKKPGPTDPPNPTLILEEVDISLWQYTTVRARCSEHIGDEIADIVSVLAKTVIFPGKQLPLDGTPLDIANGATNHIDGIPRVRLIDLLPVADTQTIPQQLSGKPAFIDCTDMVVPSFETYNISHSHGLQLEFTVLHSESGHRFHFTGLKLFRVLPREDPDTIVHDGLTAQAGDQVAGEFSAPVYGNNDGEGSAHVYGNNGEEELCVEVYGSEVTYAASI